MNLKKVLLGILTMTILVFTGCAGTQPPKADATPEARLLYAASNGDLGMAKKAINDGANLNTTSSRGYTPLFGAVWHSHPEVLKLLIDAGADTTKLNPRGDTLVEASYKAEKYNHVNTKEVRKVLSAAGIK